MIKIFTKTIKINPSEELDIIPITNKINNTILEAKNQEETKNNIKEYHINGIAVIFVKHTTAAIYINENESNLKEDIKEFFSELVPKSKDYKHNHTDDIRENGFSHIRSILIPTSVVIPITNDRLDLGTWQDVFFVDFDGLQREREVSITLIY